MSRDAVDRYFYGIVFSGAELPTGIDGVQGNDLHLVELGRIAAVLSDLVDPAMLETPEALRNHSEVLDAIAATQPVLPLAFGTVVPWAAEIGSEILAPRQIACADALEQLTGLRQFTVTVRYDRDAILREIVLNDQEAAELRGRIVGTSEDETRSERIRLGEIVVKTFERRRATDAPPILDRIESVASDIAVREVGRAEDVAEAAVLVRRDAHEEFDSVIEGLAEANRERMRFRLVGPQAPYDFVPEM